MKKINMKGMRKLSITATAMVAAAVMVLAGGLAITVYAYWLNQGS